MTIPEGLKYTKDHEWVKVEGTAATMGITEFAQSELGDVVFVELPSIGKTVSQKETVAVVESTKAASDIYAPIGGTVKEVNEALAASPDKINSDPYGAGWIAKFENVSTKDLDNLLTAEQYRELIKH